jgi:T-complex protein 1 subunit alpha
VVLTLADMDGNETFDPAALGTAEEVAEIRVADDAMVSTRNCCDCMCCTISLL